MPARPARTRRPRLLPTVLLASALVVGSAGGVLAATGGSDAPAADTCAGGGQFVTVQPVFDDTEWKPARAAGPTLTGCVDGARLEKAAEPTPTNQRG